MADLVTGFIRSFEGCGKSFGIRLDISANAQLFRTRAAIEDLMKTLQSSGVKFLGVGSVFSSANGKPISSFAVDGNVLTSAAFDGDFPAEEAADFAVKFFRKRCAQKLRTEFSNFCAVNDHWLDWYSLFCALSKQTGTRDFSKWPDTFRVYVRRTAEIIKRQLQEEIFFFKAVQFFAHKQLKLVRSIANKFGIFICGDCDIMCENTSADVWGNQRAFFVNSASEATVFTGFPPSEICRDGVKTTKVPYRVANLKNSNYEFFDRMFSNCEGLFDAVFLMNGHTIFQYWEIASCENDPKYGRWVSVHADQFFKYLDSHFNNFPYIIDFNEPLFPENEVVLKRHNTLPLVIDGEPTVHSCGIYDLSRDHFASASIACNRKTGKPQNTGQSNAKSCLEKFKNGPYKLCIFDFDEICNSDRGVESNRLEIFAKKFSSLIANEPAFRGNPRGNSPAAENAQQAAENGQNASIGGKISSFFKKILK